MRGFLRIKIASCLIRRPFMPVPIRLGHWKIEFSQLSSSAFLFSWFVAFFAGCTHTHTHTDLLLPHYYYGKVVINPQKSLIWFQRRWQRGPLIRLTPMWVYSSNSQVWLS